MEILKSLRADDITSRIWPREIIYFKFYNSMTSIWKNCSVLLFYTWCMWISVNWRDHSKTRDTTTRLNTSSSFPKSRWSSTPTCPTTSPRQRAPGASGGRGWHRGRVTRKVKEEEHHHDGSSRHVWSTEGFLLFCGLKDALWDLCSSEEDKLWTRNQCFYSRVPN